MIVIGITGGIASGKTTLARMLRRMGDVAYFNADAEVHRLLAHDRAIIAAIGARFPQALAGGRIARRVLADCITRDAQGLAFVESLLHPAVRAAEHRAIARARRQRRQALVLDIPLLLETDAQLLCDVVIVAYAPLAVRRRRAFARPGMNEQTWARLIARQIDHHHTHPAVQHVIRTDRGRAYTHRRLTEAWRRWHAARNRNTDGSHD